MNQFVRRWRGAGIAILLAGTLILAGVGVRAQSSYSRAGDRSVPIRERIASACDAATLKPSRSDYAARFAVLSAQDLTARDRLDDAKSVLLRAFLTGDDDPALGAALRDVNLALQARDARKAHQLHAKEGPDGILPAGVRMP